MSRLRVVLAFAVLLLACEPPVLGEPCHNSSPYIDVEADIYLACYGPSGCDEPQDFRWVHYGYDPTYSIPTVELYCTCEGETRRPYPEEPPNVPWRFLGSCEEPCAGVAYLPGFGGFGFFPGDGQPVAPECQSCEGTTVSEERCFLADGRIAPRVCCDCEGAFRDDEGACRSGEDWGDRHPRLIISDDCCPP